MDSDPYQRSLAYSEQRPSEIAGTTRVLPLVHSSFSQLATALSSSAFGSLRRPKPHSSVVTSDSKIIGSWNSIGGDAAIGSGASLRRLPLWRVLAYSEQTDYGFSVGVELVRLSCLGLHLTWASVVH
jgi:hypothetical protein